MDFDPMLAVLRHADLFRAVEERDLRLLLTTMKHRELKKDEVLYRQGRQGDSMAVLAKGRLGVQVQDSKGRENFVAEVRPGQVVGEMNCIDPAQRSATVWAMGPAEIYEADRHLLHYLREREPDVLLALLQGLLPRLADRLRSVNRKIDSAICRVQVQRGASSPAPNTAAKRKPTPRRPFRGQLRLQGIEALKGLTPADLKRLVRVAPAFSFRNRELLCCEGDDGDSCFLVVSGQIDVVKRMQGKGRKLASLDAPVLVGQLALVDRVVRSASLRARGDAVALELRRDVFERLLKKRSPLALRFLEETVVAGVRQMRVAMVSLSKMFSKGDDAFGKDFTRKPEPDPPPRPAAKPRSSHYVKRSAPPPVSSWSTLDEEAGRDPLEFLKAALNEWGIPSSTLERVSVYRPDGIMSSAELAARKSR